MKEIFAKKGAGAIALWSILIASAIVGVSFSVSSMDFNEKPEVASGLASPAQREFTLIAEDAELQIASGETVKAWTFNGTMPGPTLRFTEGDNVTIHFINKTPLAHTVHFHGNHDQLNDGVTPQVLPGQNYTYNFIADPAGAFMYHCHAYPTSLHIRMGMYGLIIVDPKDSSVLKPGREFGLVMSEYDPDNQNNFVPKYYPINGYIDQYMDANALKVRQNELVRFYVINIGTTIPYSFHLHSTIFKAYQSGLPSNSPIDAQTIEIGPGNAAIVEASWKSPGTYLFHSHGLMEERGNMGEIHVMEQQGNPDLQQSVSMIDWQYKLQKELQNPVIHNYGNLSNTTGQLTVHDHLGMSVRIVKGAWDKSQKNNFEPASLTVKQGSTVTWINEDMIVHTVTSKQQGLFDSSVIPPGKEWSHEFQEQRDYDYYCSVHPWMEGSVHVEK